MSGRRELVVITPRWDETGGGRERYAAELVAALSARGVEQRILCLRASSGVAVERVALEAFGSGWAAERRLAARARGLASTIGDRRLLALAPSAGATHYQLHSGLHRDAFRAEREAFRSPLRRALHPLGLRCNGRRQRTLRREAELLAGGAVDLMVFAPGQQRRLEQLGVPAERIRCCRLGVDLAVFRPATRDRAGLEGPEQDRPEQDRPEQDRPDQDRPDQDRTARLLFVGHNFALKGLATLLDAVATLSREGVAASLQIVGGDRAAPFRTRSRRLGVAAAVQFLGRVDRPRVAELYRDCDALVIPSLHDPAPRVLLEALACGCPVVASARVGGSELLLPNRVGAVVDDPRDAAGLAAEIRRVLAAPRAAIRRRAAELGSAFSFERHVDEVTAWLWR